MGLMERPIVQLQNDGGKYWEHTYDDFFLKVYVPQSDVDGQIHNYGFEAPLLLVFEENRQNMEEAIDFAKKSGLAQIAARTDSSVLFAYPTCEGGWKNATEDFYAALISQTKMVSDYSDGIAQITDFFTQEFKGYFIRGTIFRADIYSFGESADYVARCLLKKVEGEYLWGPGDITPAMCSLEQLSIVPDIERKDIAILSVGNSDEVNKAFDGCENVYIKSKADYVDDFDSFVWKYKMWCGNMQLEPDFKALNMKQEAGSVVVKTAFDHLGAYKECPEHTVGYFAYYNNDIFEKGNVPLVIGFHGGGDSALFFTFVSEWYRIANQYGFLFVAIENHQNVSATEAKDVIEELKKRYRIDENRIYATGFSMGSGKTWDMLQQYPEIFAGFAPTSALFPVKNNPFSPDLGERLNTTVSVPIFYSGGEQSHLPELPCQADSAFERIRYLAKLNKLKCKFDFCFENKESWENQIWGVSGERQEQLYDETRDAYLTIQYYESEDGVCRTALASVSNQVHECRYHSCEMAWRFLSKFSRNDA